MTKKRRSISPGISSTSADAGATSGSEDRSAGNDVANNAADHQWKPWLAMLSLSILALAWSYWPTLSSVVTQWIKQPDYSHGFLVLPISLFFLWSRRDAISYSDIKPSILGGFALLLAGVLRVLAGMFYLTPLDGWTLPLTIGGLVWLLCGTKCFKWALPSIVFLWFMIPIPWSAEHSLRVPLQKTATDLSTMSLISLGQPAIAEGNVIRLGDKKLFVEEACSGLRIFVGIFAMAFAFVLFSRWAWWQKVMVIIAAIPISICANVIRIVVTGLLYQYTSDKTAEFFFHDAAGLAMIPLAAGMFWVFLLYLDKLFPEVEEFSLMATRQAS